MPTEVNLPHDEESISMEEYIYRLHEGRYDLSDPDELSASATLLKKLGNNKKFLLTFLVEQLRDILRFQSNNYYGPEVFILHSEPSFFLRANIWMPTQPIYAQIPGFRYDICHDHNFHILTIGYFGPGYASYSYTYDYSCETASINDCVRLSPRERFILSEGRIALYRAKRDVHVQLPPASVSVSLNLIPRGAVQHEPQFEIDEQTGRIIRYLDFSGADALIRLAGIVGDIELIEPLVRIAELHPSGKLRALALLAQMRISQGGIDELEAKIERSHTKLVRDIVKAEISRYGACMNYS